MTRLTRKLSILVALLLTLAGTLVATPPRSAYAATCCENCSFFYEKCLRLAYHPSCNGDPACCSEATEWCYWTCVNC